MTVRYTLVFHGLVMFKTDERRILMPQAAGHQRRIAFEAGAATSSNWSKETGNGYEYVTLDAHSVVTFPTVTGPNRNMHRGHPPRLTQCCPRLKTLNENKVFAEFKLDYGDHGWYDDPDNRKIITIVDIDSEEPLQVVNGDKSLAVTKPNAAILIENAEPSAAAGGHWHYYYDMFEEGGCEATPHNPGSVKTCRADPNSNPKKFRSPIHILGADIDCSNSHYP